MTQKIPGCPHSICFCAILDDLVEAPKATIKVTGPYGIIIDDVMLRADSTDEIVVEGAPPRYLTRVRECIHDLFRTPNTNPVST